MCARVHTHTHTHTRSLARSLQKLIGTMEELFPKDKAAPRHGHHVLIEYTMLQ